MGFKSQGADKLKLRLQRIGAGLPNAVDNELRNIAYEIQQKAKDMAPIDYGDLRSAIRVRRYGMQGEGGRFVKGRSVYDVLLDMNQPVRDPDKLEEGYTRVGDYAWEVHEHMGWGNKRRVLMPSKKSVAAGLAAGVEAGGKFMERALLDVATKDDGILVRLIKANRNCLQKLDK